MDLAFIELNMAFFNIEKEKRNCFAIMILSVNWPLRYDKKNSNVHHYENSYTNDCHDGVSAG